MKVIIVLFKITAAAYQNINITSVALCFILVLIYYSINNSIKHKAMYVHVYCGDIDIWYAAAVI